jgi:polyferredoxin
MECIGCTQCIDACDEIMTKVHKPVGLIRYDSENGLQKKKTQIIRPRTLIYSFALVALAIVFAFTLKSKEGLFALWIRNSIPYQVRIVNNHKIITNQFKLELHYPKPVDLIFKIKDSRIKLITPTVPFKLKDERKGVAIIFFQFPQEVLTKGDFKTQMEILSQGKVLSELGVELVGPME